jgi:hypothetical protein
MPFFLVNRRGIFTLAIVIVFLIALFSFLNLQYIENVNENQLKSDFITLSTLNAKRTILENNVDFLIKETIESAFEGDVFEIASIVLSVNTVLEEYFDYLELSYDFSNNKLDLKCWNPSKESFICSYMFSISSQPNLDLNLNKETMKFKIPKKYILKGEWEK